MKAAIVFDLDGTLIDSLPDIHAAINSVLQTEGLPDLSFAQIKSFVGDGAPTLVARCLAAHGYSPDGSLYQSILQRFLTEYEDAHDLTTVYPGAMDALRSLQADGHPLGICTNKPIRPTTAILRHFRMLDLFGTIIGGDSLTTRKPDPAPLLQAIQNLGGGPALFVGDSEVDAETARAAKVPFLLYTEGYRKSPVADLKPTAHFSHFSALPGLIADLR